MITVSKIDRHMYLLFDITADIELAENRRPKTDTHRSLLKPI